MTRDKLAQLGQTISDAAELYKGHTDGRWYETGHHAYMTAEFANAGQATMYAHRMIWDNQVIAVVSGGDWDDSTIPAQVTVKLSM